MRSILHVFLACLMVATPALGQSKKQLKEQEKASPCNDARYVELLKKPLEDMTEREYEYFKKKDAECAAYNTALVSGTATTHAKDTLADQQPTMADADKGMSSGAIIAISILGAIVGLLILGAIASAGSS